MSLLEQIKSDQLNARKTRDTVAASLLTTLIGEATSETEAEYKERVAAEAAGKPGAHPDHKVIKTVEKFLKGAKQNKELLAGVGNVAETVEREIAILSGYLPTQLSVEQLKAEIDKFRAENAGANVGAIMAHLKANFAGLYDGKMASELAKG